MTGGIGFSTQGWDSFKNNRKLRKERLAMKDNPYAGTQAAEAARTSDVIYELEAWREMRSKKEKRMRKLVFGIIIPLIMLLAMMASLL